MKKGLSSQRKDSHGEDGEAKGRVFIFDSTNP
jgi:hypothetical protein